MPQLIDYRALYFQTKNNVALFFKQVQAEISNILASHQTEKNNLKQQIASLKAQLLNRTTSTGSYQQKKNWRRPASQGKRQFNTTNDLPDCFDDCISRVSHYHAQTIRSQKFKNVDNLKDQKQNQQGNNNKQINSIKQATRKTNSVLNQYKNKQTENIDPKLLFPLDYQHNISQKTNKVQLRNKDRRKDRILSEINNQNVKDVLKQMRGRLNQTRQEQTKNSYKKQITPQMFSANPVKS